MLSCKSHLIHHHTWISWEALEVPVGGSGVSSFALDSRESLLSIVSAFASLAQNSRNTLFSRVSVSASQPIAARVTLLPSQSWQARETLKWEKNDFFCKIH